MDMIIPDEGMGGLCTAFHDHFAAIGRECSGLFGNQVREERNLMRGLRYIDFIYSNKKVLHWLGWGLKFEEGMASAGVIFYLNNTLTGAVLKNQMEKFQLEHAGWQLKSLKNGEETNPEWIFSSIPVQQLSSSSDWSRNYAPRHATIDNPKNFWHAKIADDKQWLQVDFNQAKEVLALKIQGASHGKTFVRAFSVKSSIDGKSWVESESFEALSSGLETRIIEFPRPITARYFRIQPQLFVAYPAMRLDVLVREVSPDALELSYLVPVKSESDLASVASLILEKIPELKAGIKEGIGL
jgi:hypothetical protein